MVKTNIKVLKALLCLLIVQVIAVQSSFGAVACDSFFLETPFARLLGEPTFAMKSEMKTRFPREHEHYLDKTQAESKRLEVASGKFFSSTTRSPFITRQSPASIVLSEEGNLYGITERVDGVSHHSTPVAGTPVRFAGEVVTDGTGTPTWFSYRSGHYAHGPYPLKLFLESFVATPTDLSQIKISLSDRERRQQLMIPADFFIAHTKRSSTGDDVMISYLIHSKPGKHVDTVDVMNDIIYLMHHPEIVNNYVIKYQQSPNLIGKKLAEWIKFHLVASPGTISAQTYLIGPMRKKPSPEAWEKELLNNL